MTLPKYEDWTAPWEGEGKELDPDVVKRLVYNLKLSEETLTAKVSERDTALDVYKEAEKAAEAEKLTETQRLEKENAELKAQNEKDAQELVRTNALLKVRLEKGLSEAEANRLVGNTEAELLADADEFLKLIPRGETEEIEEDADNPVRRQPRVVRTPGDPDPTAGKPSDVDAYLAGRAQQSNWVS